MHASWVQAKPRLSPAGTDRRDKSRVALKVAPASDLANLKTEIAIQKLSQHPNIVAYKETYLVKDQLWIVLEYIHGGPLTEVLGPTINFPEPCIAYVCALPRKDVPVNFGCSHAATSASAFLRASRICTVHTGCTATSSPIMFSSISTVK
jgi:hypothetical protein